MAGTLVILGCGYIGSRLARRALAEGRQVRVCARSAARLEPLASLGAEVRVFDAGKFRQVGPALQGATRPTVVYSVPPLPDAHAGAALQRATEAALNAGARSFIYLSSAGLYGDKPDEAPVDENTGTAHDDVNMASYFTDEAAVEGASYSGLRTCILRLAAVYGPGRGVRHRLRTGDYRLLDEGRHMISRIYVEDLVSVILAAEEKAPQGSLYLVGDDRPTTQREYAEFLCQRLGLPLPGSVASYAPGIRRQPHRGRHLVNEKLKRDLGLKLQYPTYVEGEARLDEEERGETLTQPLVAVEPDSVRPAFIRNVASLASAPALDAGGTEPLGDRVAVGDAVGLLRVGVNLVRLPPGQRTSLPHAHRVEEELVYVLEGTPDLFVDGRLHRLRPGDVAGFPAGTGIAHTVINNGAIDARLLVVGERRPSEDAVAYPLEPAGRGATRPGRFWADPPVRDRGPHDGKPERGRK